MANQSEDENEKPLDPAVERVQQRLRRLMLTSGLTLGIGILAVFLAIGYRLMTYQPKPVSVVSSGAVPTVKQTELGVPADAELVSTALDGDRLALTYAAAGETMVIVLDLATGAVVHRLTVRPD